MFRLLTSFLYVTIIFADLSTLDRAKGATLKPLSACCDIPELGNAKPLADCSSLKLSGLCGDVQCVFEKSGFLTDTQSLNKEAYRGHLTKWLEKHPGWDGAVLRAIQDCVDKDVRQYLDAPCNVYTCTSIAMIKKCPTEAWKC